VHVALMGEKRNGYRILVGKPEGKRLLGRPWHRWVDSVKVDRREIGWGGMDWIDLAQGRDQWRALLNMVTNLLVPWNAGKFFNSCTIGGFSRRAQLHEWVNLYVFVFYMVRPVATDLLHKLFSSKLTHFIVYKTPDDGQNDRNM
jgi:hypothetical protein